MGAAWPEIAKHIRELPMAGVVKIFTVGDASAQYVSPPPMRIQKKLTENGGPREYILEEARKIILGFPDQVKGGKILEHGRSELVGGFNDASKLLNRRAKDNVIVFVSDLIENSKHANCYRDTTCRLPSPTFSLEGAKIVVIGVGAGLPAKQGMTVATSWLEFLKKAHADVTIDDLRRVN